MPPVQIPAEELEPFDGGDHNGRHADSTGDLLRVAPKSVARNVNVVKPLQPGDEPPTDGVGPQTILDPKFSRALDFKLRRLKEKEILQTNLRRPTRRPRNGLLAASNPNISLAEHPPDEQLSRSQPQIVIVPPDDEHSKVSPKTDVKMAARRSRARNVSEGEKPRFITTVKSGQFLLPPPELACLLGLETLYPPQERERIVYSYSSKPKAVASRAKRTPPERKEREAGACAGSPPPAPEPSRPSAGQLGSMATTQYSNVMHEKRVVRGSTFAAHGDGLESGAARAARSRRRALARRAAAARLRPGTPPPAPGRRHHPIQTDYYLQELFEKGVEMEVGVQTDLFVDRPATPVYVPAKTGADAFTQIYPGDLFDFDLEVQPIVEVLVGKTAEQALAEVAQEEELATLREQQRRYGELRDAELAERQRLAAQDLRLYHEKERRARERAAAAGLVRGYVAELVPAVLAGLRDQGYLLERIHRGAWSKWHADAAQVRSSPSHDYLVFQAWTKSSCRGWWRRSRSRSSPSSRAETSLQVSREVAYVRSFRLADVELWPALCRDSTRGSGGARRAIPRRGRAPRRKSGARGERDAAFRAGRGGRGRT
ncbi:hypothetical protein K1T71_004783 [Dendrolimus kikuchii]|uniref:Uncharacterized protein n=1 Tax=Dendrolimus kikuchii TaxID=765133 RepID=A0ACC1D9F0_9NEOP|nr:hypothetical protein K1T71_004783 [Dendrolimus kikuchii]